MGMTAAFVAITPEEAEAVAEGSLGAGTLFLDRLKSRDPLSTLDIDKAWAAIHFLLSGSQYGGEPPNSLPIRGGVEFGRDLGYGPARLLTPFEVKQAAELLLSITVAHLRERFDPAALDEADIYPGVWLEEGPESFEYLAHWYEQLRAFYGEASRTGSAVLTAVL